MLLGFGCLIAPFRVADCSTCSSSSCTVGANVRARSRATKQKPVTRSAALHFELFSIGWALCPPFPCSHVQHDIMCPSQAVRKHVWQTNDDDTRWNDNDNDQSTSPSQPNQTKLITSIWDVHFPPFVRKIVVVDLWYGMVGGRFGIWVSPRGPC